MNKIEMFRTFDGKLHETLKEAERHLDVLFTQQVCNISANIVDLNKYQGVKQYIAEHLHLFQELIDINKDMELIDNNDNRI